MLEKSLLVARLVEEQSVALIELCRALVRINTVNPYSGDEAPGGESAGQALLRPILEELGGEVQLLECPPDIYARARIIGPSERNFRGRPNLLARWDFGQPGPTIILNGHMDTVGIDQMPEALSARLEGDCIYGRGASDCKGGLSVGVSAIRALLSADLPLHGRLIFQSVVDEECNGSGAGTLACLEADFTGDVALFLDGHDNTLTLGCGGCLTADLHIAGQEAHGASGGGVSALEKALIVKSAIDTFQRQREALRSAYRVNLGVFRAGTHPAVVPGSAYMSLNIVYGYEEAAAAQEAGGAYGGGQIRQEFERLIRQAERNDEWLQAHPTRIEWIKDLIPYAQSPENPWIGAFKRAFRHVTGQEPRSDMMTAWSDAAYPAALHGIPTILFGPGVKEGAHSPREYVPVANLITCAKVVATFLAEALVAR